MRVQIAVTREPGSHLALVETAHRDDGASAIGCRYRQQVEIGTPFCITRER
jgi:glycyl-tRNA synthetase (class II)